MTNLIFDLNNILYRSMFIISGFGKKQYTFDNRKELDQLMRKITIDVAFLVRLINPSRVIFAVDSKSWRKDISIEENDGYKFGRKRSKHINWENVFDSLKEFSEIMESNGFIVTKIDGAEADDIIAMWVDELQLNQKQHVISVSGDEDIRQLVRSYKHVKEGSPVSPEMIFSTIFNPFMQGKNPFRKLYIPKMFNEWINTEDDVDIFNMSGSMDIDKIDFNRIMNGDKVKVEEVDGEHIVLKKIFCGDDGDNVPAIFTWIKNNKEIRITNSKFQKILKEAKILFFNKKELLDKSDDIKNVIEQISEERVPFKMKDRLIRQMKLVLLDSELYPKEILEKFLELRQEQLDKPRPNIGDVSMQSLLAGTRYIDEDYGGTAVGTNESSIFKEIDRINSKKLF
jgi:5'-3' exonuclease